MKKIKHNKRIFIYSTVVLCFLAGSYLISDQESGSAEAPGLLSKVHEELSGPGNCAKCHTTAGKIAPANCLECHQDIARRIETGKGFHQDKKEDCADCHTEHNGSDYNLIQWEPADFDHTETGYPHTGAHREIKTCDACHHSKNAPPRKFSRSFLLNDNRCSACHKDAHRGEQPVCTDCHTTNDWRVDIW